MNNQQPQSNINMQTYLKWQVGDDAGGSKANQEKISKDEGSGGIDNLLDSFVRATGLTRLTNEKNRFT